MKYILIRLGLSLIPISFTLLQVWALSNVPSTRANDELPFVTRAVYIGILLRMFANEHSGLVERHFPQSFFENNDVINSELS